MIAPHSGAGFTRPCKGPGIQLRVYLAPGGQAEPSCLLPEGYVIGHACSEIIFGIARGHDVEVGKEVSRPLGLVGREIVGIYRETPGPLDKGSNLPFPGFSG